MWVVYVIGVLLLGSCTAWKGSRWGTKNYNKELFQVTKGIDDRSRAMKKWKYSPPRELLCVTFTSSRITNTTLPDNIKHMGNLCNWAIVFYDNNQAAIRNVCTKLPMQSLIVHCEMHPSHLNQNVSRRPLSIPKNVMYRELLPYLSNYKKVFLMDEDISLKPFDYVAFSRVWECSFPYVPLIVQPLIAESTQDFYFFNAASWQIGAQKDVLSSTVGFVEQQTPLLDAVFFEWFIERTLQYIHKHALEYGTDWGHDRIWCKAAQLYSNVVLHYPENTTVCALLPGGTQVSHLNGKTLAVKQANFTDFANHGRRGIQTLVNMFPTWVLVDHNKSDPLLPKNKGKFQMVRVLNDTCSKKVTNTLMKVKGK